MCGAVEVRSQLVVWGGPGATALPSLADVDYGKILSLARRHYILRLLELLVVLKNMKSLRPESSWHTSSRLTI